MDQLQFNSGMVVRSTLLEGVRMNNCHPIDHVCMCKGSNTYQIRYKKYRQEVFHEFYQQ